MDADLGIRSSSVSDETLNRGDQIESPRCNLLTHSLDHSLTHSGVQEALDTATERDLYSLHFSHNLYGTMYETQK